MKLILTLLLALFSFPLLGQWDSLILYSPELGRRVEVLTFDPAPTTLKKRIYYFTDGRKWIKGAGRDSLMALKDQHAMLIFVSSLDVDDPALDHRETDFFCNPAYADFFHHTLIPHVEKRVHLIEGFSKRILVGISFGGLNAAYFSSLEQSPFTGFALLSPITYPCPDIHTRIMLAQATDRKIFLSTGKYDAEKYIRPLTAIYRGKGHDLTVLQTEGHHEFKNWLGQLAELWAFFGVS